MRAVVQRVQDCAVSVEGRVTGRIEKGLLVYLGVGQDDNEEDLNYIAEKIAHLRIFPDAQGKMNLSVTDLGQSILVVSQFTLYGDARNGRRPSYTCAAEPQKALGLYRQLIQLLRSRSFVVEEGEFAASMEVRYCNVGPITILLDSRKLF
jgi:D-tyrosyl-tRNA(Tyr) deacylase